MHHISILLFDGFSNLCLANAVEPLRAANTLAEETVYSWRFVSLENRDLKSSSDLIVSPERLIDSDGGDFLFVMPSYGYLDLETPTLLRRLRAAKKQFETLVGLDTGSWLLAAAGLLDGYRATSHWDVLTNLAERFPEVKVVTDRFVFDRNRASCGGGTTTLDLMLEMIRRHHGITLSLEVAALFMHGERPDTPLEDKPLSGHQTVRAASALMRRNLEQPLSIQQIAAQLKLSQRRLEQIFQDNAAASPAQIYRKIRLNESRRRLQTTREGVVEIAQRCGYQDPTAFTRAFKQEFGITPSIMRSYYR